MSIKTYFPFYKRNLAIAVPVMMSQIGQVIVQMADTMMVGRLGADELASVSFAGAIFSIGLLFFLGCAMGLTPLVGISVSNGKHRESSGLFQTSFLFTLVFGLTVAAVFVIIPFFMSHIGHPPIVVYTGLPHIC